MNTNQKLAVRYRDEVWNGWVEAADEIIASACVFHFNDAGKLPPVTGPASFKQLVTAYRAVFPDVQFIVEDIIVQDDQVTVYWWADGTRQETVSSLAATNQMLRFTGVDVLHIEDSKIIEVRTTWDAVGIMQQLGLSA